MTTKLQGSKEVVREVEMTVMDKGSRNLVISMNGEGYISIRAKGMQREVVWSAAALYEKGLREGRIRKSHD
jgi:hypothetical protein